MSFHNFVKSGASREAPSKKCVCVKESERETKSSILLINLEFDTVGKSSKSRR